MDAQHSRADVVIVGAGIVGLTIAYELAGFNGHGIMHSPPLACAMADTIVGRTAWFDLAPFSVRRFASGAIAARPGSSLL
jgi:glycine/D-amino acid oxidase-like deaminating enzyme